MELAKKLGRGKIIECLQAQSSRLFQKKEQKHKSEKKRYSDMMDMESNTLHYMKAKLGNLIKEKQKSEQQLSLEKERNIYLDNLSNAPLLDEKESIDLSALQKSCNDARSEYALLINERESISNYLKAVKLKAKEKNEINGKILVHYLHRRI